MFATGILLPMKGCEKMPNEKIFISHCEKDHIIVNGFIELLASLDIHQIVCSSLSQYKLPNEENIYDYLKNTSQHSPYVIYFLSENYYGDYACLNEMGALWVTAKEEQQLALLLDDFNFSNLQGAIEPRPIGIKLSQLHCNQRISQLITDLYAYLGLESQGLSHKKQLEINKFIQKFASLTEDSNNYFYSTILETRSTDYWPEAQFLKIEKRIPQNKLEDRIHLDNETHWLVYLNGMDCPIVENDYVRFKITGKSKISKDKCERRIYLSDIIIL